MNPSTSDSLSIPRTAFWLGYSGLIPFVVLAFALWVLPDADQTRVHTALLSYAGIILSFMGAVHWGLAMHIPAATQSFQLVGSVVPPIVAWFALLTTPPINSAILIVTFAALCIFDGYMAKTGRVPAWYPKLRIPLTVVVIGSLISAQLGVS